MIAYAKASRPLSVVRKNYFDRSVQDAAVSEYRQDLLAAWAAVPYGLKLDAPKIVTTYKHLENEDNRAPETTGAILFGALARGVDIDVVVRPLRRLESKLRALVPTPHYNLDDLATTVETQLDAAVDCVQIKFARGDHSVNTKREMLEQFEKYNELTGQIVDQLRKELFGGPR